MSKKRGNEKKRTAKPRHTWNVIPLSVLLAEPIHLDLIPLANGKGQYPSFKAAKKELLASIDDEIAVLENYKRGFKKLRAKDFISREPK